MKLAAEYFEKIGNGTKTIECRLYDEKRKMLQVGDVVEFSNAQHEESRILTQIIALHVFSSFSELLAHFPIAMFGAEDKELFMKTLKRFYSDEDEGEYGVVGIEVRLT